jgi:hypothetical protein
MPTINADLIPGMIEPVERALLSRLAKEANFSREDCAVEFGSFFGKSSAFIAKGLSERAGLRPLLFVYDSFSCHSNGSFRPVMYSFADVGRVRDLIIEKDGMADFYPVFEFYLRDEILSGAVIANRVELSQSVPPDRAIGFIHIDSPKMYQDFKPILFRFFPRLRKGGIIVFQDFFYQWSASLIAAVGLLVRLGYLEIRESAASSLACTLRERIDEAAAIEIDLVLTSDARVTELIDHMIKLCSNFPIDRPEIFLPRLYLAKVQWYMERGDGAKAVRTVNQFFAAGGKLNQPVFEDFMELMSNSFSMNREYRLDHPA